MQYDFYTKMKQVVENYSIHLNGVKKWLIITLIH